MVWLGVRPIVVGVLRLELELKLKLVRLRVAKGWTGVVVGERDNVLPVPSATARLFASRESRRRPPAAHDDKCAQRHAFAGPTAPSRLARPSSSSPAAESPTGARLAGGSIMRVVHEQNTCRHFAAPDNFLEFCVTQIGARYLAGVCLATDSFQRHPPKSSWPDRRARQGRDPSQFNVGNDDRGLHPHVTTFSDLLMLPSP